MSNENQHKQREVLVVEKPYETIWDSMIKDLFSLVVLASAVYISKESIVWCVITVIVVAIAMLGRLFGYMRKHVSVSSIEEIRAACDKIEAGRIQGDNQ